jgi:hypothetical protein
MDTYGEICQALGGGNPISSANPLPVDFTPGSKVVANVLSVTPLAAASITTLLNCTAINLLNGPQTLALTIRARYNATATRGLRIHVVSSPNNVSTGTHTAALNPLVMTDATAHFIVNELVGLTIINTTDGSSGVITANTETTVSVAALAGGTLNTWTTADAYSITGSNYDTVDIDTWNPTFTVGAVLRQTKIYDSDVAYMKVLVENLDAVQAVTDIVITATEGA